MCQLGICTEARFTLPLFQPRNKSWYSTIGHLPGKKYRNP